ncbi:MAG TPA: helix-turn-helix transcriptional regulator [Candidatus Paceibacterota bacterium]|nr:MAG: hypothetical protein B7X03_00335 [Parcubacteria group bacterium 21-58-10]OYV83282.1 MAG: hypothetical protein B7W96_00075 [Parcubacteria group bacterium 37-58-5]HQT82644.1 helix-turn-helix transcriptional regulator [Candidatus Paceibacterota bacterium]
MKLNQLQKKVRSEERFKKARQIVRKDIAFQIAHLIEGLRLSLGLSQSQFAKKVGLQQPAVARFERGGNTVPSLPMLQRIADAFDLELILPNFVIPRRGLIKSNSQTESKKSLLSAVSPYYSRTEGDHRIQDVTYLR